VLKRLLSLTQTLNKYELLPEEINYDSSLKPTLSYGDIQVEIGDDDYLSQKVGRISELLPELAGKKGTLHLETWTPDTTDIFFEPAE
jgi:cell division protein FtsQ